VTGPVTWTELQALLDGVADYESFLPVDDLLEATAAIAGAHPDRAAWERIGTSRLDEPIYELTVAGGPRHALVFAGVHPNEPIGSLTCLQLARSLTADPELTARLGYTWHIIPCIDPDGMRLNESWFGGSMTRVEYGRGFYRPAPDEQVEWTFPFKYKDVYFDRVMPETVALMRVIDDTKPVFMCSLHNGELGGVYYYLSHEAPELYGTLSAIPEHFGLPLDVGEPEAPYIKQLAPAIYGAIRMEDAYEYSVSLGIDPKATMESGDSSASYARKYGTFMLVSELPYWIHPDASDESPSDQRYGDVVAERGRRIGELADLLEEMLSRTGPDLTIDSPFLRATRQFAPLLGRMAEQDAKRAGLAESDRPATVAEAFSTADLVHGFRLRYGGMLIRALRAEVDAGLGTPRTRAGLRRLEAQYDAWCEQAMAVTPADTVPIRSLVGVQYGAIVAAADYAARHREAG